MKEKEVKDLLFEDFSYWMRGQTCSLNKDGSTNYYKHDVEAYRTKTKTGYDRQKDPLAWD